MTATKTKGCDEFNLDALILMHGAHGDIFDGECCLVEAANVAATCIPDLREKYGAAAFTDDHPSISRVIRSFCISWNDAMRTDEERTRLLNGGSSMDTQNNSATVTFPSASRPNCYQSRETLF